MTTASSFLVVSFIVLAILVGAALPAALYRATMNTGGTARAGRRSALAAALAVAAWMAATAMAAMSGRLDFGRMPPPMMILFVAILGGATALALSPWGRRLATGLPLAALVGFHAFRLPLELLMHRAYEEGVMPVQMSYSGYNFDILTGVSAMVVAGMLASGRLSARGAMVWNVFGMVLLANILVVSWLSAPTPLRVFMNEPANVWITDAPFVWLPTVLVFGALAGHLLILRRLRSERWSALAPAAARRPVPANAA